MITKLNLASKPFRNRTLPYLISLLLLAFAVAGTVVAFAKWREAIDRNELALKDINQMEEQLRELNKNADSVRQQLAPQERELLVAAHKLVANKSFGWSRLFADLEGVLPGSVSASRIAVEDVFKDGDRIKAQLELGVLSRDYPAVMAMIDNMNSSGIFRAELRSQDLQKTESITYTEYTLSVVYTPSVGYSPNIASNGGNE